MRDEGMRGMETEVKLIPKNKDTFLRILEMDNILSFSAEVAGTEIQKDTYYDTPDHKLAKAGTAYRIRDKGGKLIATFKRERKREDGLFKREEFEAPIEREELEKAANGEMDIEPIRGMRELLSADESVVEVLTVEDERTTIYLSKDGKVCFELTLDNVTFTGAKGSRKHQEIELEKKDGDETDMLNIVEFLKHHFDFTFSSESKYEIGLKAVG